MPRHTCTGWSLGGRGLPGRGRGNWMYLFVSSLTFSQLRYLKMVSTVLTSPRWAVVSLNSITCPPVFQGDEGGDCRLSFRQCGYIYLLERCPYLSRSTIFLIHFLDGLKLTYSKLKIKIMKIYMDLCFSYTWYCFFTLTLIHNNVKEIIPWIFWKYA